MENEKPKNRIERNFKFDDRRKVLTHEVLETKPTDEKSGHVGDVTISTKANYNKEGIKNAIAFLESQKKTIKEDLDLLKEDKKLKELGESLEKISRIKNLQKQGVTKKGAEAKLKDIDKDLKQIKEVIRTRLNLK